MDERELMKLLDGVRQGSVGIDEAFNRLRDMPYQDIGFAIKHRGG